MIVGWLKQVGFYKNWMMIDHCEKSNKTIEETCSVQFQFISHKTKTKLCLNII